jgi:HEAT repeat protein
LPFSALFVRAESDSSARKEAAAIAERLAERTVPAFVALSEHPAVEVRSFALGFLGRRSEPEATRAVVAAVNDVDPGVRRAVLASLGPSHAAAAPALISLAGSDDWSLRVTALEALGRIVKAGSPPSALSALERAASKDDTALVREAALTAISRAAPELSRAALERARDSDPEPHVRKTAGALLRSITLSQ